MGKVVVKRTVDSDVARGDKLQTAKQKTANEGQAKASWALLYL